MLGGGGGRGVRRYLFFPGVQRLFWQLGRTLVAIAVVEKWPGWVERRVNIWSIRRDEKKVAVVE